MNKHIEVWGLQQQCLIFGRRKRRNGARGTEIFFGDCCIFAFAGFFAASSPFVGAENEEKVDSLWRWLLPLLYGVAGLVGTVLFFFRW